MRKLIRAKNTGKNSYLLIAAMLSTVIILLLTMVSGLLVRSSNNMCAGCHGNRFKEYCNLLPDDALSVLPTTFDMENGTVVIIAVEIISTGDSGPQSYFRISELTVTLASASGKVSIPNAQQVKNNLYPDDKVVFEWTVTGTNKGDDTFTITLNAFNPHFSCTATDQHSYGISVISNNVVPREPRTLSARTGDGHVHLSWIAPSNDGGSPITEYKLYRGTGSGGEIYYNSVAGNRLDLNDTDVVNGEIYYYYVTAVNSEGESNASNEVSATPRGPPSAPSNFELSAGDGFIVLSWEAPADDGGSPVSDYLVYRGSSANNEEYIVTVDAPSTSYNDTGLENLVTYYYLITARNALGESVPAPERSATPFRYATEPAEPRNITLKAGNGSIRLAWVEPHDNGGLNISSYRVYRGEDPGGETYLSTVLGSIHYFNDTSVTNGVTYHYLVTARNSFGEGEPGESVYGTPMGPPSPPQGIDILGSDGYIRLSWEIPVVNGGSNILSYIIYRGTDEFDLTLLSRVNATKLFYNDTDVVNGKTYFYRVSAANSLHEGGMSAILNATAGKRPSPPRNLAATVGDGYVDLFWDDPLEDNGIVITEYRVYRGSGSGNGSFLTSVSNNIYDWYRDDSVEMDERGYFYRVTAVNEIGESDSSDDVYVAPVGENSDPTIGRYYPEESAIKVKGNDVVVLWVEEPVNMTLNWYANGDLIASGISILSFPVTEPGRYDLKARLVDNNSGKFTEITWQIESSDVPNEPIDDPKSGKGPGYRVMTGALFYGGLVVLALLFIYLFFFYRKRGQ